MRTNFLFIFVQVMIVQGLVFYAVGALCAWDANPANWSPIGRSVLVIVAICSFAASTSGIQKERIANAKR